MKQAVLIFSVLFILSSIRTEDAPTLSQEDFNNPELIKVLNNYYGCKVWLDGVCTECSQHYYFNKKGICCEVKPQCKQFNRQTGLCEGCYQGYELNNGVCVVVNLATSIDRGCRRWKDGVCSECSISWYFGPDNVCYPVDDFCKQWKDSGECQQCYKGYLVGQNNKCIRDPYPFTPAPDSLCAEWKDRVCLKCAPRSYFDDNGICKEVDPYCNTWDIYDGECLICYKGYRLNKGACVLAEVQRPTDLGCRFWDWDNQKCLECSTRFVFDFSGVCVPVNDYCAAYNLDGACTTCYKGYKLNNGDCVLAEIQKPKDLNCKLWDWDNQRCLECSARHVFSSSYECVPVSDYCATYEAYGACTSCYQGYALKNGKCELHNILCKETNSNGYCSKCYTGYVLYRTQCVPISKLANISQYYQECCPEKLAELRNQKRIN